VDSKTFSTCICAVGWTAPGEWLLYDFQVLTAGNVDITVSISSYNPTKQIALDVDGEELAVWNAPGNGWDSFADRVVTNIPLDVGDHELKLRFLTGQTNVCMISLVYSDPLPPTPPSTPPPSPPPASTRIKMYHELGYFWQCDNVCDDSDPALDFDPKWCLQCDGTACEENEFARMRTCDETPASTENTMFELDITTTELGEEAKIKASNSNLCLTVEKYTDKTNRMNTKMKPCDGSDSQIWWTGGYGSFSGSVKFEVHPKGDPDYCLTTQHHPKDGEDARVEKCAFARKDVSNFWIKYTPE